MARQPGKSRERGGRGAPRALRRVDRCTAASHALCAAPAQAPPWPQWRLPTPQGTCVDAGRYNPSWLPCSSATQHATQSGQRTYGRARAVLPAGLARAQGCSSQTWGRGSQRISLGADGEVNAREARGQAVPVPPRIAHRVHIHLCRHTRSVSCKHICGAGPCRRHAGESIHRTLGGPVTPHAVLIRAPRYPAPRARSRPNQWQSG
jgi:hypothetical protein